MKEIYIQKGTEKKIVHTDTPIPDPKPPDLPLWIFFFVLLTDLIDGI